MTKKELMDFRSEHIHNGEFQLVAKGEVYNIKSKSVGLGQYQVWLEISKLDAMKRSTKLNDSMLTPTQADKWAKDLFKKNS
jgi:hypothetical protein